MSPALPSAGQKPWDSGLNSWLRVAHNADGTLIPGANGQWLKTAGGAAVWQPITQADISGVRQPIVLAGGMQWINVTIDGNWHYLGDNAGGLWPGFGMDTTQFGPGALYTQYRWIGHIISDSLNGATDWTIQWGVARAYIDGAPFWVGGPFHMGAGPIGGYDSGWQAIVGQPGGAAMATFQYLLNAAGGIPSSIHAGVSLWVQ